MFNVSKRLSGLLGKVIEVAREAQKRIDPDQVDLVNPSEEVSENNDTDNEMWWLANDGHSASIGSDSSVRLIELAQPEKKGDTIFTKVNEDKPVDQGFIPVPPQVKDMKVCKLGTEENEEDPWYQEKGGPSCPYDNVYNYNQG
jgi:hypothetical protein